MTTPKKPAQQKLLPLLDPNNVPEVFVNQLTGVNVRDDVGYFTFSVIRQKHSGVAGNDDVERVVALRCVMPEKTADAMMELYSQLKRAMQLNQMVGETGSAETLN